MLASSPHPFANHERNFLKIGIIICLGVLIYSNVINGPFMFDDEPNILKNRHVQLKNLTIEGIYDAAIKSSKGARPLAYITFALEYYFYGHHVEGYHVVNIIIHILNGILIFYFLKVSLYLSKYGNEINGHRVGSRTFLFPKDHALDMTAFFATLIWFVNPIQTQSVSYIVQRMNSMAVLFYLLAFNLYISARFRESNFERALLFVLCSISGILSYLSKEIAATLPLFIFLYELYFFRDFPVEWIKKHIPHILIVFLIFGGCLYLFMGPSQKYLLLASYQDFDFTMPQRVMTEFRVVIYYLTLLLFPSPSRLHIDYDYPISYSLIDPITTVISLCAIIALFVLALYTIRSHRLLSFGILWYLGNLVIESSVIGIDMVFEHRTYLPSIFIFLLFVIFVDRVTSLKYLKAALFCAILILFSLWTYERNLFWSDERMLWEDCVQKAPKNKRAHYTLGCVYMASGLTEKAIERYRMALKIDPDYGKAHTNMGIALWSQGKKEAALQHYQKAIQTDPRQPEAHNNLGTAYFEEGEYSKAIESYQNALRLYPYYYQAYNNLGLAFYTTGETDKAIEQFIKAIQIKPDYGDALTNLGAAFMKKGYIDKAMVCLEQALRLDPKNAEARTNLDQCIQLKNPLEVKNR